MTSFHMGFRVRTPSGTESANVPGTPRSSARRKCSDPPRTLATAYVWVFFLPLLIVCALGCASSWKGSVGAVLGKDNRTGRVFVREVPSGMGAARAGLEEGDE